MELRPFDPANAGPPVRVALLGLGTVGAGVLERLSADPRRFAVVGVAIRDIAKPRGHAPPPRLLFTDPDRLFARPWEVLVELIGGLDPAGALVERALQAGRDVVTANKALVAERGEALRQLATATGARLRYSAAVGGEVPVLETIDRLVRRGRIDAIEAVLNGTTNFVLDRLADGDAFDAAVGAAQRAGFAEADPTLDLSGMDAAQKLAIIAWHAFGERLAPQEIEPQGISHASAAAVRRANAEGRAIRLLATCRRHGGRLRARVAPRCLPAAHPLAQTRAEENRVLITLSSGRAVLLAGRGAGREPTTDSVLADLAKLNAVPADRVAHASNEAAALAV